MNALAHHQIKARKVQFDFSAVPKHWIPNDAFSTHFLNVAHLVLPAGEFWFCRVYNKALPYIKDEQLKQDVLGFIRQEAVHGRTHQHALQYFKNHQINVDAYNRRMHYLFEILLGEAPAGLKALQFKATEKLWLLTRLGVVAAIEHFTGVAGQWSLDNTSLNAADPVMADLFRWHLAEEVEHRSVAFDLFAHLFENEFGFYLSRQALMAIVLPILVKVWVDGLRAICREDADAKQYARYNVLQMLWAMEKTGRKTDHVPRFSYLLKASLRWLPPSFHPVHEGNTQQALDYLNRSPAARAAA